MRNHALILAASLALALLPGAAAATSLSTDLAPTGDNTDIGSGFAAIDIDGSSVSYSILTNGHDDLTVAHIHSGADNSVVVNLEATFLGGLATGAVSGDQAVLDAIVANPAGYYLNVHSTTFPNGALRGTLAAAGGGGSTDAFFPVVASVPGQAGTFFSTDVRLLNRSGNAANVEIWYLAEGEAGNTEPTATATLTIPANAQAVLDDIVNSTFGIANGKGALRVVADAELDGLARIYNDQSAAGDGTFGQASRALSAAQGYPAGALMFLSNRPASSGAGFRTNIGWFNPNQSSVDVTFRGWDANGTLLGEVQGSAAQWAQVQVSVQSLWPALADYGDFYVTYETAGGENLIVYASVVDNVNGDAVFIEAVAD